MRFRFGLLLSTTRQRDGQSPTEMTVGSVEKDLGVRDTTPSWCVMRECGLEPLQLNWLRAAMRLYDSLTKSNSYTMKKVLHADMQLSTRSGDCWSLVTMVTMGGDLQPGCLADRLMTGLGQPQINP